MFEGWLLGHNNGHGDALAELQCVVDQEKGIDFGANGEIDVDCAGLLKEIELD